MTKSDLRQETSRTADLGCDTHLTQNDSMTHIGRGQSTHQIATRSVQSFLHQHQVISRVGMSAIDRLTRALGPMELSQRYLQMTKNLMYQNYDLIADWVNDWQLSVSVDIAVYWY